MNAPYLVEGRDDAPIAAAAIHDGHALRPAVALAMVLTSEERLREEDPFTGGWTSVAGTRLIGGRSRFEVDLNRPREKAVYRGPEDAWGLSVWRDGEPRPAIVEESLAIYDAFHHDARSALEELRRRFGRFVVLDLHSYNHRRAGPEAPPDDPRKNPDVNVGTRTLDRKRWGALVERLVAELRGSSLLGRPLDVRENVRFRGGNFASWVHHEFPDSGCALAIDVKKFFMDEWTGVPERAQLTAIGALLASTIPGLLEELERLR